MSPTPLMCVLQTQQKHLGSFLSLMFYLKLTRELIVLTFLGSCCHTVIVVLQVRNIQSFATIKISRFFYVVWCISQQKYITHNKSGLTFQTSENLFLKNLLLTSEKSFAAQYFFYEYLLSLFLLKSSLLLELLFSNYCSVTKVT